MYMLQHEEVGRSVGLSVWVLHCSGVRNSRINAINRGVVGWAFDFPTDRAIKPLWGRPTIRNYPSFSQVWPSSFPTTVVRGARSPHAHTHRQSVIKSNTAAPRGWNIIAHLGKWALFTIFPQIKRCMCACAEPATVLEGEARRKLHW